MRKFIKKMAVAAAFVASLFSAGTTYAADAADMPVIMRLKTNIYGYVGPDNSFSIYLGSTEKDCEFYVEGPKTQEYIWVDPYTLGQDGEGGNAAIATQVALSVTESNNTIEIRGDASKIDYIDAHGCYLSEIYLSPELTNLSVIDLSYNELTAVDLSAFPSLNSIDILANEFKDPSKMVIGTNHPNLLILSVGINDVCDPNLDLRNFPNLLYFSARNNYGLTRVDPSNCPNLISLVLEVTNVSSLDVSKNLNLDVLNISNTKILNIDLSKNTALGEFYASHEGTYNDEYKLTSIDVSKNPQLQYLDLSGNRLTSIDVTHNPNLLLLYLQRNLLTEIDLSKNTRLAKLDLSNNLFTFATLPLPKAGWDYYYYRSPLACNFKYKVGEPIDFSADVIRAPYYDDNNNLVTPVTYATVFAEPRGQNSYQLDESQYTYENGVVTFNEAIADSVYVDFYCTAFPDWTMRSANFMVKTPEDFDAPAVAVKMTPTLSSGGRTISFKLGLAPATGSVTYPADIIVQIGASKTEFKNAVTKAGEVAEITFKNSNVPQDIAIMMTDGFVATQFELDGLPLTSIDLSASETLRKLAVTKCSLLEIDLSYNNMLEELDLSGNYLTSIDLKGVRGDYEKFNLRTINLSNNLLSSISATYYDAIYNLNMSGNNFSDFDFKYYTGLRSLDLSNNKFSGTLDLEKSTALKTLNIQNNAINEILVDDWSHYTNLNLTNNNLSFSTLPVLKNYDVYNYAPQNKYNILSKGQAINLASQNINGATTYTWKYVSDKTVVPANLYTFENGVARFGAELVNKEIYCEMVNPTFPDFNDNPLTTTNLLVLDKPTTRLATFTSAETATALIGFRFNSNGTNAVYIDWNGDGSQYDEYLYESNTDPNPYREGKAVAGKTAVVYTYDDPTNVGMFFINGLKLKDIDLTGLTRLRALDLHNTGLEDGTIKLPQSNELYELVLDGNNFKTQTFPGYSNLWNLNLAGNGYETIDLSIYPSVGFAQLSSNNLSEVKFGGNSHLFQLDLSANKLKTIDLRGLSNLQELLMPDNMFETVDLSPVAKQLHALNLAGNYMTFATLPRFEDFDQDEFTTYYYANQKPMYVECVQGKVDLSAQASVNGTQTEYRWFLGNNQTDVYYDYYYEMFVGEELESPEVNPTDPEYGVNNGVTSFFYTQNRRVIGAMTNSEYPNLILYTVPVQIDQRAGVDNVSVDAENGPVDVYNMNGVRVRNQVERNHATDGLTPGLYIVGGEKVLVR